MKQNFIAKCIISALLVVISFIAACTTPSPGLPVPSATIALSTGSISMRLTTTYTPTAKPSPILPDATVDAEISKTVEPVRPVDTPTPNGEVTWATGIDIQPVDGIFDYGSWSPTRDEIVYFPANQYDSNDIALMRFAAPDFQPQEIRAAAASRPYGSFEGCTYPDLVWTRNGQRIFFSGPVINPPERDQEPCSIWMVEHDGSSPRLYHPEQSGRSFSPIGWIDDYTLVLTGYREGIHVLDLLTGNTVNWALPRYAGRSLFTRDYFVGTDNSLESYQMYALSRRNEPFDQVMVDGQNNLHYALTPPPDRTYDWTGRKWSRNTILYDALPDTNQVLGSWFGEVVHEKDNEILKIFYVDKLVLWDIDQNTLTTLVPYGEWGDFSPDQRTLAYVTRGPAMLDEGKRPVDPNQSNPSGWYPNDTDSAFLQLLDRSTGTVFLSVPVASFRDFYDYEYIHVGANFSPDGQYLSFITDRKIAFDAQGWPEMVQSQPEAENGGHLYVLDVKNHRLIWDQGDLAPIPEGFEEFESTLEERITIWSPTSKHFIYLDAENNAILVDLNTGVRTAITLNTSGMPHIKWSSSGKYVAVQIPDGYSWRLGFLKMP